MEPDVSTLTYEQALSRLEKIVYALEHGEGTLDEALNKFQEGMALSRVCSARLAVAEQAIQKVVEQAGSVTTQPFSTEA